jgi:hypothetical protein
MLVVSFACAVIVVFNNLSDEQRMRWARRLRLSLGLGIFAALVIGPYNAYWPGAVDFVGTYFKLLRQVNNSLTVLPAFLFILLGSWQKQRRLLQVLIIVITCGVTFISEIYRKYIGKPNLFSRHGFGPHCFRAGKNICPALPTANICLSRRLHIGVTFGF